LQRAGEATVVPGLSGVRKTWQSSGAHPLDQIIPLSDDDLRLLIDETLVCRGALLLARPASPTE